MTIMQIRDSIRYALKHRNEIKCENKSLGILIIQNRNNFHSKKASFTKSKTCSFLYSNAFFNMSKEIVFLIMRTKSAY